MRRDDKISKWLLAFIAFSLLLHVGIFVFLYEIPLFRSQPPTVTPPKQEVVFVRPQDMVPAQDGLPLVDIAKPKVEKAPKRARFASQYDSTVKEETVARRVPKKADPKIDVSDEPKRPKAKRKAKTKPREAETPKIAKLEKPKAKPAKPGIPEGSEAGKPGKPKVSLSDLQLKTADVRDFTGDDGKGDKPAKGKETAEDGQGTDIAALPRSPGPSGKGDRFVHDFLPGIKIGDKTYLNTRALPNVQYFLRLKRIFRLRFNPRRPLLSHFRHNRVAVGKVNVTMAMEVSSSGQLTKLFVVRSSGIPGYDREAIRTVRQSAPFSAPPKKIRGKDGKLRMTWHFTTYL